MTWNLARELSMCDRQTRHPDFPLPVMLDDSHWLIVKIPAMTQAGFEFFRTQLDVYAGAIVIPELPPTAEDQDV